MPFYYLEIFHKFQLSLEIIHECIFFKGWFHPFKGKLGAKNDRNVLGLTYPIYKQSSVIFRMSDNLNEKFCFLARCIRDGVLRRETYRKETQPSRGIRQHVPGQTKDTRIASCLYLYSLRTPGHAGNRKERGPCFGIVPLSSEKSYIPISSTILFGNILAR